MCGLVGIVNKRGISEKDKQSIEIMSDQIGYRGPDDQQLHHNEHVMFSFRRLSIIDINEGIQPFHNEDHTIYAMVNGEIYNHSSLRSMLKYRHDFSSKSDCEVILHLYEEMGMDFLEHVNGMFSLAIYDKNVNKLFLAKDRFNIKPLFFHHSQDHFIFCSEIKGLLHHHLCPREFDWKEALQDPWIIANDATSHKSPSSYFKGITNLPGGSFLALDICTNEKKIYKYWDIKTITTNELKADEIIEKYLYLLEDSVKNCLMADTEVGLFLSGGIDSIAIGKLASKYRAVSSFSVMSQSTLANGDAEFSHKASRELNLENFQVLFHGDLAYESQDWKQLLWLCENPMIGPEQLFKYHLHRFAKEMNPQIKVILSGQGSDEFNGGYSKILSLNNEWDGFTRTISKFESGRLLDFLSPTLSRWSTVFGKSPFRPQFLYSLANEQTLSNDYLNYTLASYRDIQMYNCWHEDRTAAGNHIENRVPFLDHRIVELCLSTPKQLYKELFLDKQILRTGMKTLQLPDLLINRPKTPFYYGEDTKSTHKIMMRILANDNYSLIEEAFGSNQSYFDLDSILSITKEIENDNNFQNIEFITRLINMGLLDQMSKDLNTNVKKAEEITIMNSIKITNWDTSETELKRIFGLEHEFNLDIIPKICDNVELLKPINEQSELFYILIDGEKSYLVEKSDNRDWFNFMISIDNESSIRDILEINNIVLDNIKEELIESFNEKILKK